MKRDWQKIRNQITLVFLLLVGLVASCIVMIGPVPGWVPYLYITAGLVLAVAFGPNDAWLLRVYRRLINHHLPSN